jgi:pimeloyl-ACP methyl ester carboxylesterase
MRARHPDVAGTVDRDGVPLYYEVFGDGSPTVVLVPTWSLLYSRTWKMQVPYLSRHFRVVTYDPRGNGRSGRPLGTSEHSWRHYVADLLRVMDATGTDDAVLVGYSVSALWCNITAVLHPERVRAVIAMGPSTGLGITHPHWLVHSYADVLDTTEDWAKENQHFIRAHHREYVEWFATKLFNEPHSTKQIEDAVEWALETDAATLVDSDMADVFPEGDMAAFYARYTRPLLVIQGGADVIIAPAAAAELAHITGAELATLEGCGHCLHARDPVRFNRLVKDFVDRRAS